jgi:hypothetical protein
MTNDVVFAKLSVEATSRIRTTARYSSSDLHICLMAEGEWEIQEHSQVAGLPVIITKTSLTKH